MYCMYGTFNSTFPTWCKKELWCEHKESRWRPQEKNNIKDPNQWLTELMCLKLLHSRCDPSGPAWCLANSSSIHLIIPCAVICYKTDTMETNCTFFSFIVSTLCCIRSDGFSSTEVLEAGIVDWNGHTFRALHLGNQNPVCVLNESRIK